MGRKTIAIRFSVDSFIAKEYARLSVQQGTTKSELFRRMVETYKTWLDEEEFFKLQRKMVKKAHAKGIFAEKEQA